MAVDIDLEDVRALTAGANQIDRADPHAEHLGCAQRNLLRFLADTEHESIAGATAHIDDPIGRTRVALAITLRPEEDLTVDDIRAQHLPGRDRARPDIGYQPLQVERRRVGEAIALQTPRARVRQVDAVLMAAG